MDKNTLIRTGVASTVAAAGLVIGGVAIASADDDATTDTQSEGAKAGPRGGSGFGVRDSGAFAEALGVSEDELKAALKAVREDVKGDRPAKGERLDADAREARQGELAAALAEELGISEDKVTEAMDSLKSEVKSEVRTKLSERLDTAVTDGDLTEAEKAAVLKAFDAGVLGAGGR